MRGLAAAVILLLAAGTTAAPDFAGLGFQPYDPPRPAPVFSLPDLEGKTRTLADYRDKVVLLFFWATW